MPSADDHTFNNTYQRDEQILTNVVPSSQHGSTLALYHNAIQLDALFEYKVMHYAELIEEKSW